MTRDEVIGGSQVSRTPIGGDLLVKDGRRYEYRGEWDLAGAPGFLLCELDGTYLEGSAPHWAPDFALSSFEHIPSNRSRYAECAYPKCCTPVDRDTCGWLRGFDGKRFACVNHEARDAEGGEAA